MRNHLLPTLAVALLLVTAGCAGLTFDSLQDPGDTQTGPQSNTSTPQSAGVSGADDGGEARSSFEPPSLQAPSEFDNYTALYEATKNSVVEIRVQTARGQGQGSGFIYHSDGYIVTNQHVVSNAEEVSVGFASGEWRTGEVVGTDTYTDLAVVRVESPPDTADPLPLTERNPDPGQPVAAIGSPLGFQGSITQGIVSGTNRSMPVGQGFSIPDTVQTDAAINPGNSGGPLVSMNGTVLGVNRAKAGDNIGFAISADVVQRVVPSIIENGSYSHAYLGIQSIPLTPDVAEANELNTTQGVMVVGVAQDGPADGNLQAAERRTGPEGQPVYVGGDVIVGIEGRTISSQHDLARHLLLHAQPGEQIEVTVLRDGERVTETVTLEQRPDPRTSGGI